MNVGAHRERLEFDFQERATVIAEKIADYTASAPRGSFFSFHFYPPIRLFGVHVVDRGHPRMACRVYQVKAITAEEAGEIVTFCLQHGISLPWTPDSESYELLVDRRLPSLRKTTATSVEQQPYLWRQPVEIAGVVEVAEPAK